MGRDLEAEKSLMGQKEGGSLPGPTYPDPPAHPPPQLGTQGTMSQHGFQASQIHNSPLGQKGDDQEGQGWGGAGFQDQAGGGEEKELPLYRCLLTLRANPCQSGCFWRNPYPEVVGRMSRTPGSAHLCS